MRRCKLTDAATILRPMSWGTAPPWRLVARGVVAALGLVLVTAAGVACSVDRPGGDATPALSGAQPFESMQGTVRVFAASSLSNAFAEVIEAFEATNPGITIEVNYGGSSALREQILDGAPVDVFASANETVMAELVANEPAFANPVAFASNQLVLVAPAINDGAVRDLRALEQPALFVGLCAPEVPCGQLAESVLATRNIVPNVDSYEPNVSALTNRLIDRELDVGLIYATDAAYAGDQLTLVDSLPESVNRYPIASRTRAGALFVDYLTSEVGQALLASYGFGPP